MSRFPGRLSKGVIFLVLWGSLCGCQTAQFYSQAICGEYKLLKGRRPVAELLRDPHVSAELKEKFELVLRLRAFAESELKLPINNHYLSYVDLGRRYAVWNVHAAPEFSSEPRTWWYPFVGSLKYRGYFAQSGARDCADLLKKRGDDIRVEGVEAFSTLGWFADPLLNTFIHRSEAELAEVIFHELAHQKLFLSGDTDFNEAFATAVAEEGVRRWYQHKADGPGCQQFEDDARKNQQFVALIFKTRERLRALYGEGQGVEAIKPPRLDAAAAIVRREKARIIEESRGEYQALRASWGGYSGYDAWFAGPLNNAQLNTVALYYQLVPGFQTILRAQHGDLDVFYKLVRDLRRLGKDERHRRLQSFCGPAEGLGASFTSAPRQPPGALGE